MKFELQILKFLSVMIKLVKRIVAFQSLRQQMSILRQRISSLQEQVVVLKTPKSNANKNSSSLNKKLLI